MTTNLTVDERTGRAQQILSKCVCLVLERHYLGNNRKVEVDDLVRATGGSTSESEVDDNVLTATKALVDPRYLAPCRSIQNRARAMLRSVALPAYGAFGDSAYLVTLPLVKKVNDDLNALAAELKVEGAKLATVYQKAIEEQRKKLGPLFNIDDYARPSQVTESFQLDWHYIRFGSPENLEDVDHALAEEADRKNNERLASAFDEVLMGLRRTALEIVSDLVDRLGKDEATGKPRVIRSSALDAVRQFAELLPQRNVGGDDKLARAMDLLTRKASGLDVAQLRDDQSLRDGLHQAATEVQKTLAGLVRQGPRRGIKLPGAA